MTQPSCLSPLDWDSLLAYWLGELDAEREAQIEEHYLGCEVCSSRLEWLTTLAHDVRALVQQNSVSVIVNNEFVRRLKEHGQQVREYHVPCNGSVNCTVNKEDDYVIAYLEVPLDDVAQVSE